MIGSIYTDLSREAWVSVPGRSVEIENNENGDPIKETYINQGVVCFAKYYTYDADGNVIEITCMEE